ncbi:MAG TPA: hypothetical protein DEB39_00940 [Planctomycetaceae bacterium]|nr:hypothetical protein [Planctomycetaceae bacterium]
MFEHDENRDVSIDILVDRYVSGALSEQDAEMLLAFLESGDYPELPRRIRDNFESDVLIRQHASAHKPVRDLILKIPDVDFPPHIPEQPGRSRNYFVFAGCLLFALGLISLVVAHLTNYTHWQHRLQIVEVEQETLAEMEKTSSTLAVVAYVSAPCWSENGTPVQVDDLVKPGPFRLESGIVVLRFLSGASLVIEGPAELELKTAMSVFCLKGRLKIEVPPQATGFSIETPHTCFVDLGTSFDLDVTEDTSSIHVVKGEVAVGDLSATSPKILEGESVSIAKSGRVMPLSRGSSTNNTDLWNRLEPQQTDHEYEAWKKAGIALNRDPHLLVHFDFEQEPDPWGYLQNVSESERAPRHCGVLVGAMYGQGRWPQKGGVELRKVSDRIRLELPGDHASLSVALWLRVDALQYRYSSLVHSDAFMPGECHWFITRDGFLTFAVQGDDHVIHDRFVTSAPFLKPEMFGRWISLAVVLDGEKNTLRYYFNGKCVEEFPTRRGLTVRIGAAEIGSWNSRGHFNYEPSYQNVLRNLCGCIDEFLLLDRVLTPGEIRKFHRAGSPESDKPPR